MRRLPFLAALWAWLALSGLLADRLRLSDTGAGSLVPLVITLGGVLALWRLFTPRGQGEP